MDLGDLAGERARGAGGGRHHERLALLRLSDVEHPDEGRDPVVAEQPQRGEQVGAGIELGGECVVADHGVLLPPGQGVHEVPHGQPLGRESTITPVPEQRTTSPICTGGK